MPPSSNATYAGLGLLAIIMVGTGYYFSQGSTVTPTADRSPATAVAADANNLEQANPTASAPQAFTLSDGQKQALSSLGIAPESIPGEITASQVSCFESTLGVERVAEIRSGAIPSTFEFLKAKGCL